jgi:hypothetical protein
MRLAASTIATFGVLLHSSLTSGSPLSEEYNNATELYINDGNTQKRGKTYPLHSLELTLIT